MKLREYFLLGLSKGLAANRHWVNSLFTQLMTWEKEQRYELQLFKNEEGNLYFYRGVEDEVVYLEDHIPGRLPLHFRDAFHLAPGDISNYRGTETVVTTYGNVFFNNLALQRPFGDLFDFPLGYCTPDIVESQVEKRLISNVKGDRTTMATGGKFYVWQYIMFIDAMLALPGYADNLVTPITKKSLMAHPDRNKVRDEEKAKYAGQLSNPVVIAKMTVRLKELDKEWRQGDESNEFYEAASKAENTRMKVFYQFGGESAFSDGTEVQYIEKSLEEGLDTNNMDVMNNALRFGSYNRGSQTALGGESTKTIYRMVGTVRIVMDDCEVRIGVPTQIRKFNASKVIGLSVVDAQGNSTKITQENLAQYMDKTVTLRSPMTCKAGAGTGKNVCAVCMGAAVAENPNGIPAAAAGVGGRFLTAFLKAMHKSTIKFQRMNLRDRIT